MLFKATAYNQIDRFLILFTQFLIFLRLSLSFLRPFGFLPAENERRSR